MKTCTKCKEEKDLSRFSKRKNPNKTKTVYINSICNDCLGKAMKIWRNENKDRFNKYQNEYYHKVRSLREKGV